VDVAGRYARDPISVQFDGAAARLLRRAYSNRGEWVGTYVANPSAEWQAWAGLNGWPRLLGPDVAPGGKARTAWCRSFVRSCWNLHQKFMTSRGLELADTPRPRGQRPPWSLQYQVGTVRIAPGGRVVGRAVRVRLLTQAEARKFAATIPDSARWLEKDGTIGPRHAGWTYTG
jgi:hypothetical protein